MFEPPNSTAKTLLSKTVQERSASAARLLERYPTAGGEPCRTWSSVAKKPEEIAGSSHGNVRPPLDM